MIKGIIFDWAGVIGADGYWIWLRKNVKDIDEKSPYFQDISEKVDRAEMSHEDFEKLLAGLFGKSAQEIWQEIKREIVINDELVRIIRNLKNHYKIGLLSNFTYPWLNELISENNLYALFDAHVISSQHKVIKPNKEAFDKILGMLGVSPGESVFIDDRQGHVDAAKKFGLKGLLFKNNSELLEEFRSLGVKT